MPMDRLDLIWAIQQRFTQNFISSSASRDEKIRYTKEMLLHLIAEVDELLNAVGNWKMHRIAPEKLMSRYSLVEEAVDIFKFLLNVLLSWGVMPDEFFEAFKRKSALVEIRYDMERRALAIHNRVAVVDIDGVLNEYPASLLQFIAKKTGRECASLAEAKKELGLLYDKIKHEFRESGLEAQQLPRPEAKKLLDWLRANNYSIVLLTSRPATEYRCIEVDTLEWLKKHELPYDLVLFAEDKLREVRRRGWKVRFVLEDDLANALRFAEEGYRVYWLNTSGSFVKVSTSLIEVENLLEVIEFEKQFAENSEG